MAVQPSTYIIIITDYTTVYLTPITDATDDISDFPFSLLEPRTTTTPALVPTTTTTSAVSSLLTMAPSSSHTPKHPPTSSVTPAPTAEHTPWNSTFATALTVLTIILCILFFTYLLYLLILVLQGKCKACMDKDEKVKKYRMGELKSVTVESVRERERQRALGVLNEGQDGGSMVDVGLEKGDSVNNGDGEKGGTAACVYRSEDCVKVLFGKMVEGVKAKIPSSKPTPAPTNVPLQNITIFEPHTVPYAHPYASSMTSSTTPLPAAPAPIHKPHQNPYLDLNADSDPYTPRFCNFHNRWGDSHSPAHRSPTSVHLPSPTPSSPSRDSTHSDLYAPPAERASVLRDGYGERVPRVFASNFGKKDRWKGKAVDGEWNGDDASSYQAPTWRRGKTGGKEDGKGAGKYEFED